MGNDPMFFRRPTAWHIINVDGICVDVIPNRDPAAARVRTPHAPMGCVVVPVYERAAHAPWYAPRTRLTGYINR